jgi:pyruvate kinase
MFPLDSFKKVKIVATIGPASDSVKMIAAMADAGVDVFRLNMSHLKREDVQEYVKNIREAEKKAGRPLAIMGDLAGPKIRIGEIEGEHRVAANDRITIYREKIIGNADSFSLNHPTILDSLQKGAPIFLGDGIIKLEVDQVTRESVSTRVVAGGTLKSRMGFSAQGLAIRGFAVSAKDKMDVKALCGSHVDAIAISFVQTPNDVAAIKKLLPKNNQPMLVAKIETAMGVERAEEILREADALMVARGDLGFAVPLASVPHIQKHLITIGRRLAKPVITATQMLESMIENHMPTRAEISDVANAILDGTDAVMLSAETATGKYPLRTVETMAEVIMGATLQLRHDDFPRENSVAGAVSNAVVSLANELHAKLIVVLTESSATARHISCHRPKQPILACSRNQSSVRRMNFCWGIIPMTIPDIKNFDQALSSVQKFAQKNGILSLVKGDLFVVSAGVPFGRPGSTNLALVQQVD